MDSDNGTAFFRDASRGFPRTLPENCVEYMLFVIDNQVESRALLANLENVRKTTMQLCERITKDYIWQRDSFQLRVERNGRLTYLRGVTDYGDSVEDEWLIVYLLRELTRSFPNLWVRVFESDSEFLLVEAANVLPKWLTPEIDSNRVWIHQGSLKILPLAASSEEKRPVSCPEAVTYLGSLPSTVIQSPFIEAEAFYRLGKYPAQISASVHHSVVTIPRKLAHVLHEMPKAISPAVEAFYLRNPAAMKSLVSSQEDLHFPSLDLVTVSIKFTKVLFAQLKAQHFDPPPTWSRILETVEDQIPESGQGTSKLTRLEMGMKVTSAFEMLAVTANNQVNRLAHEFAILLEDLEEDGDQVLPNDRDIAAWPDAGKDDDESWLDISFEDLENELQGTKGTKRGDTGGFGDASTQADLRKIVTRFEAFLNDETAGLEGAEMDEMDEDDDISEDENSDEDEDKEVSFDERQFTRMMKEMMGMPPPTVGARKQAALDDGHDAGEDEGEDEGEDGDEDEAIQHQAAQIEAELKRLGALTLDSKSESAKALNPEATGGKDDDSTAEESDGADVNIDYNLAKNLLESFKSQAGTAGPIGNMLGMMDMRLPRDEDGQD